ncbi:MAG: leucine-rich repeat domain-containing protein [bacterium]|nr:leucine-rich repeat domain-containing protein [bacterium]
MNNSHNSIEDLYHNLKNNINHERLKEISADIIEKYKRKDTFSLLWYASLLGIPSDETGINRMFAKIIRVYHPDKMNQIRKEIDSLYERREMEELVRIKNIYLFKEKEKLDVPDYTFESEYEYSYNEAEFGYSERNIYEEEINKDDEEGDDAFLDETDLDEENSGEEYGFIEAIHRSFFANLEFTINAYDLQILEGQIDLSDYDIIDLKGIEYCINISGFNLSGNNIYRIPNLANLVRLEYLYLNENNIDSIDSLKGLDLLKELDISFNEVEDISVLLALPALEYVNIIGNPVEDLSIIEELKERGVIVIW